ncbi:MAG: crossover junction endodeoxyribonuclease RuvC [Spirochaetales bacterium]|nr:crossover junction endodeoxyribonuclease RuvC [Spirochaetales bacterium]
MVLGFDPGFAITGWGALEKKEHKVVVRGYGTLETAPADAMTLRLSRLFTDVNALIAEFRPERCVVERLFFTRNQKTAAGVYQARGVILAAIGLAGLPLLELTPQEIKQALTGSGRASKSDVLRMVERLLGVRPQRDDAADGLACALAGLSEMAWRLS